MSLLNEGQMVRDTYEVERFLGEGAFAEVYRVKHSFLGRQAIKVFKRVGMTREDTIDMLGEAILLTKIGHPNIVRVYDANIFESDGSTRGYFTMEHVSGGSLDKFWRSHGGKFVPVETALELIKQVCRGLALAHRENPPIIHRDIKPQNILVGYEADGLRARVSDFGLAKKVNPLTLLATAAGTLAFKPPEAFAQDKADSCAGDVWAIGTTLYLLLTDRLPFDIPADATWMTKNLFAEPLIPPSAINPDVDRTLDEIVLSALRQRPQDRYPDASRFLNALEHRRPAAAPHIEPPRDGSSGPSKTVLGRISPPGTADARRLVDLALAARGRGRLSEAADLMEEAFNRSADLRSKYAHQVRLWRCGITM